MYVVDTNVFITIHTHFDREVFVGFWESFESLIEDGELTSCREVLRELEDNADENLQNWISENPYLFPDISVEEGHNIASIFSIPHFQQNIERKKLLAGGKQADAMIIARAMSLNATVVSQEKWKDNSAKIPNICHHFSVNCVDISQMMRNLGWRFN